MKLFQTILYTSMAVAVLSSCSSKGEAEAKNDSTATVEEVPFVEVDMAYERVVPQIKEYTANVEAFNTNNISPSAPNRILTITAEEGDVVRKGQVLVTLDRSNIDQLKVNIDQIEREYNRARNLLEIGAGTQQAVDQLKSQLDAARTQYNNLAENTTLVSPINGVVTARNYDPGDMTGAMPVLTVGQLSPVVKVIINVTENDMQSVHKGQHVQVTFDAFKDEVFDGNISRIYPTVDRNTRTFQAEVQVQNPGERIRPGMFARVSLDLGARNSVVVPDRAVVKQSGSGNRYVYVFKDGKVSYNRVELGRRIDDSYELISGVANGDTVVITGQTRLADGVNAKILEK